MTQSGSLSPANFDVFLSLSHKDARWVEDLAKRLNDEEGLRIWLDKWILIPGEPWQQAMASGIVQAKSCVFCISENAPSGWFKREIERALNHQTKNPSFRVVPLILPNGKFANVVAWAHM